MTMTARLKHSIPFILLFLLLSILWHELYSATPSNTNDGMVGDTLPSFQLPTLNNPNALFTQKSLQGHVTLLNVFASWCSACNSEHAMLMRIKNEYHIPMYGIAYRDRPSEVVDWLKRNGNPYVVVGNDQNGSTGVDLGIYGTPETFVISPQGKIVYRQVGVIDQSVWDNKIYPIIKQYEHS